MAGCGDVLSLEDLQTAKKHQIFEAEVITGKAGGVAGGASIDYATNQVTGQTQKTLPAVLRDAGFRPASFTFATGGTLVVGDSDVAVLWPVSSGGDGQYYIWKGAYPKVIPASSSPASTGGVSDSGWLPWGDITLRDELASSAPGKGVSLVYGAAKQTDLDALATDVSDLQSDLTDLANAPNDFSKTAVNTANANLNVFGRLYTRNNIALIGDSITRGNGASNTKFAYASLLAQAISNYYKDGYRYPLIRNAGPASYIYSSNGGTGSAGLSGDSISLAGPAQWAGIFASEGNGIAAYVEVSAGTAATIQLVINGSVVASAVLSGSRYKALLTIPQGTNWTAADDVRVTCPSGTLVLSGLTVLRYGNSVVNGNNTSPLVITCGRSGESFEFYRTNIAETAAMGSDFGGVGKSIYIVALGTNSLYNASIAQTPAEYVASMLGLQTDLKAINSNIDVLFTIPPQANEALSPIAKPGFTYKDYVSAIRAAVPTNQLIDLNIPGLPYTDGVHPSDAGHVAIARRMCESLGIPFDVEPPTILRTAKLVGASPLTITNGYVCRDEHGIKTLAGQIAPNGTGSTLITTLSGADFRPRVDRYAVVPLIGANGFGTIHINAANGEIRMIYASSTWTAAYLDGVSYI